MKIFGRKVKIPPTPAKIPSFSSDVSISPAPMDISHFGIAVVSISSHVSKYPFIKSPTVNVRKNTSAIIAKKTGMPKTG